MQWKDSGSRRLQCWKLFRQPVAHNKPSDWSQTLVNLCCRLETRPCCNGGQRNQWGVGTQIPESRLIFCSMGNNKAMFVWPIKPMYLPATSVSMAQWTVSHFTVKWKKKKLNLCPCHSWGGTEGKINLCLCINSHWNVWIIRLTSLLPYASITSLLRP